MGIGDWFKKDAAPAAPIRAPTVRRFPLKARFDPDATARLASLFRVDREGRDNGWMEAFWNVAWTAALVVPEPPVVVGPDGFPYLRLELPGDAPEFDANSLSNVAASLVDQGLGAAFFASAGDDADAAEYVMSMGVLDSILQFDEPAGEPMEIAEAMQAEPAGEVETSRVGPAERSVLKAGQQVLVGAPSRDYLSAAVARALYRHLIEGWGLADPRVSLMMVPAFRPTRSLVIGKSATDFAAEGVDEALMMERVRMLSWYLPPSRRLMLMPDDWSLEEMTPLRDMFTSN